MTRVCQAEIDAMRKILTRMELEDSIMTDDAYELIQLAMALYEYEKKRRNLTGY